ncbi:thiamine pyrophosphate-requiring enzyme [Eggerthella sp. YY7918]|nr:thiamine pyrophosphate-requiring enzyme [Eggerthella sp. YY7918]
MGIGLMVASVVVCAIYGFRRSQTKVQTRATLCAFISMVIIIALFCAIVIVASQKWALPVFVVAVLVVPIAVYALVILPTVLKARKSGASGAASAQSSAPARAAQSKRPAPSKRTAKTSSAGSPSTAKSRRASGETASASRPLRPAADRTRVTTKPAPVPSVRLEPEEFAPIDSASWTKQPEREPEEVFAEAAFEVPSEDMVAAVEPVTEVLLPVEAAPELEEAPLPEKVMLPVEASPVSNETPILTETAPLPAEAAPTFEEAPLPVEAVPEVGEAPEEAPLPVEVAPIPEVQPAPAAEAPLAPPTEVAPAAPTSFDAESYFTRATALRDKGLFAVAARLYAECAAQTDDSAIVRKANLEEMACYVKAGHLEQAQIIAESLVPQLEHMSPAERVKVSAVMRTA